MIDYLNVSTNSISPLLAVFSSLLWSPPAPEGNLWAFWLIACVQTASTQDTSGCLMSMAAVVLCRPVCLFWQGQDLHEHFKRGDDAISFQHTTGYCSWSQFDSSGLEKCLTQNTERSFPVRLISNVWTPLLGIKGHGHSLGLGLPSHHFLFLLTE